MIITALSHDAFLRILSDENNLIVDTRVPAKFADGFIADSVFISTQQIYPATFHSIFPERISCTLIIEKGTQPEAMVAALNGIGFIDITGFFEAGSPEWQNLCGDMVITIDPDELAMDLPHDDNLVLIDVRSVTEFAEGHLKGAQHLALEDMGDLANIALIPEEANVYLYCSNGNRSMTAASLLKIQGIHNIRVVMADWEVISSTPGLKIEKVPEKLN
ncbi:MAG: rhodanese-like domain-containing protein [Chitinophagaceae bacterium]|nr:rhodanese-like domain-containing protein [Chitinophagaceae bacterium]